MTKVFKKHNPQWVEIKTIITDKEFTERSVLGRAFPDALLLICLFHVSRTFRREITCEKLGITNAERLRCLEIINSLIYSRSEEEYRLKRNQLLSTRLQSVIDYFNSNWHNIRDEWVEGLKSKNLTFLNRTNNRLESINQKIKDVCTKYTSLQNLFEELFICMNSLATERDSRALELITKRSTALFEPGSPEESNSTQLTPYSSHSF